MKIAFHIHSLTKGGAERAVANLAEAFVKKGHDVSVITSIKNSSEYPLSDGVMRHVLTEKPNNESFYFRYIFLSRQLRKLCKKENYDVLVCFISGSTLRGFIGTLGLKTKIVTSVRNDPKYEYAGTFGRIMMKYVLPLLDGCVFQTKDAKDSFPAKVKDKSTIIFNAINPQFFSVERKPVNNKIVSCGRLAVQKNHELLIRAFVKVHESIPESYLEIYGKGEKESEISNLISTLNVGNYIFLRGETSDIKGVLSEAEMFILSSDFEGMPNALMEAMAAGVPCISTDCPCGGPRSLIHDGVNGILVPVKNEDALKDAILKLKRNDDLRMKIGQESAKSSRSYTIDNVGNQWLDYLNRICK